MVGNNASHYIVSNFRIRLIAGSMENLNSSMDSAQFRQKTLAGDKLIGTFLNTGSPTIAEMAGVAGLDWCLLDMEHGSGSWEMLAYQLMALSGTSTAPIVRLPSIESVYFKRALDLGAWGLMLPNVNTPEEARNP